MLMDRGEFEPFLLLVEDSKSKVEKQAMRLERKYSIASF